MDIFIRVIPNAKQTEIVTQDNGYMKIRIHSPAKEGRANKELVEFLAKKFRVSKINVEIIKGLTSKDKLVRIYL